MSSGGILLRWYTQSLPVRQPLCNTGGCQVVNVDAPQPEHVGANLCTKCFVQDAMLIVLLYLLRIFGDERPGTLVKVQGQEFHSDSVFPSAVLLVAISNPRNRRENITGDFYHLVVCKPSAA
jgi:hypothetical protein